MRVALKAILFFLNVSLTIFAITITRYMLWFSPQRRMRAVSYLVYLCSKFAVFMLGIKIKVNGQRSVLKERGIFFVSNHTGYLDGIVISSLVPLVFIGRSDLKSWPLFGVLSSLSHTIYVNRISPYAIQQELKKIMYFLHRNINIILFPEGTSTDGTKILPFKTSFFEAPLQAKAKIVPLTIRYNRINNQDVNNENRDLIYWYGDMTFVPHLLGVLSLRSIVVEITVSEPVVKYQHQAPPKRKHISHICQGIIEECLSQESVNA
ncbi:MAG: 1-acyl-sn-glycerol-3-phosphate acyltransferase [Candidatus Omnitrophota bacterium]|nr:MAG: 1-acyl-sn-glycerol-3-phosphate acyltransferase [Candidatus Omnitrophota bacterium]